MIKYIVSIYFFWRLTWWLHFKTLLQSQFFSSIPFENKILVAREESFESETKIASALLNDRQSRSIGGKQRILFDYLIRTRASFRLHAFLFFSFACHIFSLLSLYIASRDIRHAMSCLLLFSRDFLRKVHLARGTNDQLLGMRDEHPLPVAFLWKIEKNRVNITIFVLWFWKRLLAKHGENIECIKISLFHLHLTVRILLCWEFKIRIGDNLFI